MAASISSCGTPASHREGSSSVEHGLQGAGASVVVAPVF